MVDKNTVLCSRLDKHVIFNFVNIHGDVNYDVSMVFLHNGLVITNVGGASYKCKSDQIKRIIDLSSDYSCLNNLTYAIVVGDMSFYIPFNVNEELSKYSEFENQIVID
ncbi:hypothetical protein [Shewanella frigidimarina]|uniref:hypothetical protein n=1 Tax=Shewanella frigidimarina TaxID=56812 RepID=UPI003D7A2756